MAIFYAMTHVFNNDDNLYNMQCDNNVSFYASYMLNCIFQIMFYKCFISSSLYLNPFFSAIDLIF